MDSIAPKFCSLDCWSWQEEINMKSKIRYQFSVLTLIFKGFFIIIKAFQNNEGKKLQAHSYIIS